MPHESCHMSQKKTISTYLAGGTLCFCLFIILWGAYVRISHSGDGCGPHWPDCLGQYIIGVNESGKTWVEWIHRATSGFFGLMVLLLSGLVFFQYPTPHPVRKTVLCVLFFTVTEALLGARLVLAGLTGSNSSFARAMTMNLHLLNSLILVGSLFICWQVSLNRFYRRQNIFQLKRVNKKIIALILWFFMMAFLGAFSALAGSLFPSSSLWQGLRADFNTESSYLIRLRFWHPFLALGTGGGLLFYMLRGLRFNKLKSVTNAPLSKKHIIEKRRMFVLVCSFFKKVLSSPFYLLIFCLCFALLSGLLNLILLSPVVLKLTHLLAVYMLEISFLHFGIHKVGSYQNTHRPL